ncbi:metalloprotease PmbA [Pleionea mediterranea]|uniref:Microcin-processing peptidase 1 n=1 Tax=Pleionea mediterranea TaxID=523701 RepID=A0A316FJB9_9GAMM|nr:metalloprotease PmbA [Pleionea mediterranea]PWK47806.1 microcin-processing peptidase 1 [Pleionea mediterranea]
MTDQTAASLDAIDMAEKITVLQQVCDKILTLAKEKGASAAEVGVSQDNGLSVQVRGGSVETVEFNQDSSFGISVFYGQRKGMATTTDTRDKAIEEAVEKACNIAKFTSPDPYSGLADAELMASDITDLDLDHPSDLSVQDMIGLSLRCESAGLSFDKRISQSDGAGISGHRNARVYANSHGFMGESSSTRYSMSNVLIGNTVQGMQREYWYTLGRKIEQLETPEQVGKKAAQRVIEHLGARSIKTVKVPVLMVPEIARGLFGHFLSAIRGSALYRNATFLPDSIGQRIFPEFIRIDERPRLVGGLASSCFDNEGVATFDRDIIDQGVLQSYVLGSYSARKLGLKTTANAGGLHNVFISHNDLNFKQLLAEMGSGLVVTEVMGQGVNMVTGDYSRGAAGFWVEQGEIKFPVHEVTIAGNLKDMFNNIRCVGNDLDHRSSVLSGSVLIDGMTVAGS